MKKIVTSLGMSVMMIVVIVSGALFSGCVQENPPVEKTVTEQAVSVVNFLKDNNYTSVYAYFNSSITSRITEQQFQNIWEQQVLNRYGNITAIVSTRLTNESGNQNVYVTCNFSKQENLDIRIVFNSQNRVISLTVVPTQIQIPYTPPSYVNQSTFTELSVMVGSGEWMLPGNLTVPNGVGPFPAVVLVQGSGPNDQDETIGPNKPFKDIAWGLASQGIIVLRYVKRTKQYPAQVSALSNFTVKDETIDDAIAAVSLLNSSPIVNHSRMYVLGHSLGGYLAPRIASQDHRIAGIIILAGPTRPIEDLILEQVRYLANLTGINESVQIAAVALNVTKIKSLNFTDNETIFGGQKSYWTDLAPYDPVATARTLHIPMMILQGLRDYQVTMEDFARWNETFYRNTSVTLRTYPSLNHLFISGTGVPTNTEYTIPGHVDSEVITDIASWIKNQ